MEFNSRTNIDPIADLPMPTNSPDAKTICPVCKKGRLKRNESSSLLGLVKRIYVECSTCGAAFFKIDDKYCLNEIRDENYPNWQRYNHQVLTVREWNTIAQGGYSDDEQKQVDLDIWLQQLASGTVTVNPLTKSHVVMNTNERLVFAIPNVIFSEPRAVRETTGIYGGPSVRITKGLSWRMGGFKAKSESHEELKNIDQGTLTITNKKLVFTGSIKNTSTEFKKILSVEPYSDGFCIHRDGKQKPEYYTGIDTQKISFSVQGRTHQIPLEGMILKILIEREI